MCRCSRGLANSGLHVQLAPVIDAKIVANLDNTFEKRVKNIRKNNNKKRVEKLKKFN